MLSVFIPVYNEEKVLETTIKETLKTLGGMEIELFIVDDTSTDGTPHIAAALSAKDRRVRHLRYGNGPSRRENLAKSFRQARGKFIAFLDADLSASPVYIPKMLDELERNDADMVIASRYLPDSNTKRELSRLFFSRLCNWSLRLFFASKVHDHQYGLKLFKRDVILGLVDEAGYDEGMTRGFSWDAEILLRAQRHGHRIIEYPIKWVRSDRTSVRPMRDVKMIPYLVSLRMRL